MMKSACNHHHGHGICSIIKTAGLILAGVTGLYSQDGDKWIQQTSATTQNLNDVFFIDANTGWAVGHNGTILNTTNGGGVWITQNGKTSNPLHALFFINSQKGWVVGGNGTILHTTNGGENWSAQSINTTSDCPGHPCPGYNLKRASQPAMGWKPHRTNALDSEIQGDQVPPIG
jgi:hypothetical protein